MTPATRLTLTLCATHLVFAAQPGLDIATSAAMFDAQHGFWLAGTLWAEVLRQAIWALGLGLLVGCLAMAAISATLRLRLRPALWMRAAGCLLIGPGLLVNGLFKAYWGRARPRDITEFGGTAQFTPPVQITDQCTANCSFVSGEGALAIMAALVVWALCRRLTPAPRARHALFAGLALFAMTGAGLRIAMGAHFLSDTIFAGLICGYVWLALQPAALCPRALSADAATLRARLLRPALQKLMLTSGRFSAAIRSRSS